MDIPITSDLEQFVIGKVTSGQYPDAQAVVADALNALRERELRAEIELEQLRKLVAVGAAQLESGQGRPWDVEEINARLRKDFGRGG